jgi:predicted nucleotidyltransferase
MDALALLRQHEPILKKRFGVAKIGIFGSFVRGEERPESDVDVLVTFRKGEESFDHYMDCKFYLEDLFGRNVDLVMKGAIKPRIREYILGGRLCIERCSSILMIFLRLLETSRRKPQQRF